jgi:hypothetical protein
MERYRSLGVDCVAGRARLIDPHRVAVDDRILSQRGTSSSPPVRSPSFRRFRGLPKCEPLTSENLWELDELPSPPAGARGRSHRLRAGAELSAPGQSGHAGGHGGSPAAARGSVMYRPTWSVCSVTRGWTCASATRLRGSTRMGAAPACSLHAEGPAGAVGLPFDRILVAVGSAARTALASAWRMWASLRRCRTAPCRWTSYLRTTCPNVYACGDLVGPYQFTHMASHQAWFASVNALFGWLPEVRGQLRVVPWATFTDP